MIKLTLTEEQAQVVATACEFYARMRVGQNTVLLEHALDREPASESDFQRKEEALRHLLEARKQILPELRGMEHSYGYGKFPDADQSFDVYQVLRYALGSDRKPWSLTELPKCEKEP